MRAMLLTSPVSGARTTSYCWISWEGTHTGVRICDLYPLPSFVCFLLVQPLRSYPWSPPALPGPHGPPASAHSPVTAAAASPAPQSCGPGKPGPHSQRAQSQMDAGPQGQQAGSSSASGKAGSSLAQGRCQGHGTPHSGRTQTGSAEQEQAAHQLRATGQPWQSQLFSPTHVLGEEEAIDFDFLFRDDPGVHGDHRVEAAGKRRCRFASGPPGPSSHLTPGPSSSPPAPTSDSCP